MASDLLLGWILGIVTVSTPVIYFKYRSMKEQIAMLSGHEDREQETLAEKRP